MIFPHSVLILSITQLRLEKLKVKTQAFTIKEDKDCRIKYLWMEGTYLKDSGNETVFSTVEELYLNCGEELIKIEDSIQWTILRKVTF